jgi:hypothetical protein
VQGYCPHNKYVPQRVRPTAKPGQARRIQGKYALREASGIKEKAGDIRCEGWKYGSFVDVKSIMDETSGRQRRNARIKAMVSLKEYRKESCEIGPNVIKRVEERKKTMRHF